MFLCHPLNSWTEQRNQEKPADYLVKEVPQGFVAFAFVADLRGRHPAGAGVDVSRAVFLARVIQVARFGGVQAVVFFGGCGLS